MVMAKIEDRYRRFVDLWNGGQFGNLGTSGMGTYASTWDGLFRMNLDRQFNRISASTNDMTVISQSRAIYINVEAYRNAHPTMKALLAIGDRLEAPLSRLGRFGGRVMGRRCVRRCRVVQGWAGHGLIARRR